MCFFFNLTACVIGHWQLAIQGKEFEAWIEWVVATILLTERN